MSLQLERSKQLEYNLAVLKRRDADISKVLDMAGHVVLYQFNEDSKVWDRKNVEGSLFVVERSSAPQFLLQAVYLLGSGCTKFPPRLTAMYFVYIVSMFGLFAHFFVQSYTKKPTAKKSA